MTETAATSQTKATKEALNWLIVLQEEPEDEHVKASFRLWLNAGEENRAAWDEASHLWDVLGKTRPGIQPAKTALTPSAAPAPLKPPFGRLGFRAKAGCAIAGLAMVVLVALYLPVVMLHLAADHLTAVAETSEILLEDGTVVTLGAASAISLDFTPDSRAVNLLAGEAWFEVKPDSLRPFVVEAGDLHVTVLGTGFNVRVTDTGASVSVGHGRVAVGGFDQPLDAGDWLYRTSTGDLETGSDHPELIGGWRTGILVVKDRPVSEVVAVLDRYLPGGVSMLGAGIGTKRVTGVYDLTQPEASLEALRATHGGKLRWLPGGRAIFSSY